MQRVNSEQNIAHKHVVQMQQTQTITTLLL